MKVSICIPAYKHPHFLKRCLDSVLEQDFSDYEIVITDDSPDNTLQKLVSATYNDDRIRYYKNEKPLGSPRNWNEAIRKAQGEYIKILHHDDWLASPQSLKKYVAMFDNNPDVNIAFSGCCDVKENGDKKIHTASSSFLKKLGKEPETVYRGNQLGAPSVCVFRNRRNYLFNPHLIWLVDTDFYIRVIAENGKFIYSPELLVNIGISEHQITQSDLASYNIRLKERMLLFNQYNLKDKSHKYRRSLLRLLAEARFSIMSG